MARLNRIWWCKTISFTSKFECYKSLIASILLYGCETWTLFVDTEKRIYVFKTKSLRKLLHISYLEHKANNWVWSKVNFLVGPQEPLLATVKRWKLAWFGMSHALTASPKPSFRAPWRAGDAMVGRGNAGWTTSKSGHPWSWQTC